MMNDLIKEFAERVAYYGQWEGDGIYTGQLDLVGFAELIVKECATVADHWVIFDEGPLQYGPVGEKIKEHFGVEIRSTDPRREV